jgi:ribosomal protein L16 Arg81 hydroxylase
MFNSVSFEEFIQTYWNEKLLFTKANALFHNDFSIGEFEFILNSNCLKATDLFIISPQKIINGIELNKSEIVDSSKAFVYSNEGYTIKITNIHKYSISINKTVNEILLIFPDCQIKANVYFSRGKSSGLNPHYDAHHVIIYQVFGSKTWHYGPKIVENPTTDFANFPFNKPDFTDSIITNSGDYLYIPPGIWHGAKTEEVSLHITFGIYPPRWKNLITELSEYIYNKHSISRSEFPISIDNNVIYHLAPEMEELQSMLDLFSYEIPNFLSAKYLKQSVFPEKDPTLPIHAIRSIKESSCEISKELSELVNDVWSLSENSISIYIRGSYINKKKEIEPWDLDLYLLVETSLDVSTNRNELSSYLSEKHNKLPPVDLKIIDKFSLLYDDNFLMQRFLLDLDGQLIKGQGIKNILTLPELNEKTISKLEKLHASSIRKKIDDLFYMDEDEGVDIDLIRTLSKALLRFGMFILLKQEGRFVREINECAAALRSNFPNLASEITTLLTVIEGKRILRNEISSIINSFSIVFPLV